MGGNTGTTNLPGVGSNIFETASNAYNTGTGATTAAMSPGAVPFTMNQYLNPYQEQVVDDTLGRMYDDQQRGLNDIRGQAAQASAYGGARHGLVEAEFMDRSNRNMGEAAATMLHNGFNTAATLGQNRIAQILQGGGQMVNSAATGLNMGQAVNAEQSQSGAIQQALMQQILGQAAGQYDTYAGWPQQSLATALSALQGNPLSAAGSTTSQYTPGLFDYMSMGLGILGGGK